MTHMHTKLCSIPDMDEPSVGNPDATLKFIQ
jgi:hypothetical protein